MMKTPQARLLLGMLAFALLDQGSKWLAKAQLVPHRPLPLWPHAFQLTLTYNTGAAFSLFHHQPHLLTGFTVLLISILLAYGLSRRHFQKGELLGTALILGGALGNLVDRLFNGRVTDFLDVVAIHYPIFNVADSFIFLGVALLVIVQLKTPAPEAHPP